MQDEGKKSPQALREERILAFWKENTIFEKSLEKNPKDNKAIFYDGPPFATGLPHYGHILGGTGKDAIARYKTMQGYYVARRWGWDCHGLPIETIVEKSLGIKAKSEIEAMGLDVFAREARSKVLGFVHEWKKTVDRTGRWVNFDGSYKTMDNTFMESVWWTLGEFNKKGLIYEGFRVLMYCPRCQTPLSNAEIAMDNSYKDITDISVYVKFKILDGKFKGVNLLAWTTTPWTLPGNTAVVVNKDIEYAKVKVENDELIIAKEKVSEVLKDKVHEVLETFQGGEIIGASYEPIFPYFKNADLPNKENIWKVWHADFVTLDKGTGIAHQAPAFGEEDAQLAKENKIPLIIHVDREGKFTADVKDFVGLPVKPLGEEKDAHQKTDIEIIKYLAKSGALFDKEKIVHSYPHCYRCGTPLLYYSLPAWFVDIQGHKQKMLELNEKINWVPEHLRDGRFKHIVENAPDWNISRNRFWATPLPIWKSPSGKMLFINSLEELKKYTKKSGNKYFIMRHGESVGNGTHTIANVPHDPNDRLSDEGKKQVEESANKFKDQKIDLIISSTYTRAKETAKIIADVVGYPPEDILHDARLGEIGVGDYEGKSYKEYHDALSMYTKNDWINDSVPGGESLAGLRSRVGEFLHDIEGKYQDKNILFVGHSTPSWMFFIVAGQYDINADVDEWYRTLEEKPHINGFIKFKNAEIRELNFTPFPHNENYELDFHRPYIDEIKLVDDGEEYVRIPEVLDCWFESGSMPFAQDHYPFENKNWHNENFPADFVVEYIAQTRTWFYYTLLVSTVLFGEAPFKNVVTTGNLNGEDGRKMSKSLGNYPDPTGLLDQYGADALRLYLMGSVLMKGEDSDFISKLVDDVYKKTITRLQNCLSFLVLYPIEGKNSEKESNNVLDQWIMARLNQVIKESTDGMEKYSTVDAVRPFDSFVDDLSTWYLRRSRDRIKDGDNDAKQTLYFVLKTFAKVLAPFAPFTAEDIWLKLKNESDPESVHLAEWPRAGEVSSQILENMRIVRDICTEGNALRKKSNIPVRQPLATLFVTQDITNEYAGLVKDELNVKNIEKGSVVEFDENITPELKREGDYRELVRAVQDARKDAGLTPSDVITLTLSNEYKEIVAGFEDEMKRTVVAKEIKFADTQEKIKVEK